ncbi:tetratricopeptide repeat protein [Mesonia sp. K7]|uniref:tetratricopeptide repeat protein n=1 Tax=Mesonia sp. K7 TaxID=2218606 RepID=UPI000DA7D32E|nr:tetratricopeptide repeat protein [Mesonia sp. K7]PZD78055.1 hypothetical protein DNG35_06685 [Mesonia sp. K7]
MIKKVIFSMAASVIIATTVQAQQTEIYTNNLADYNKALRLYNSNQFAAAQLLFKKVNDKAESHELKADCAFYIADCAVKLNHPDADELVEGFVEDYPTSTRRNSAYANAAMYYFNTGDYESAGEWYNKVDISSLSKKEQETYYFQRGYVHFKNGKTAQAKKDFNQVVDSEQYGRQAKYYLGFMAYEGNNLEEADELFEAIKTGDRSDKNLSYFQSNIRFKQGKFQEAIDLGVPRLERSNRVEQSELNKIIGESYFNLGEYEKAIPYLKAYDGKDRKWSNTDYYQLGYAYYKQGDYQNAVKEFSKIIDGKDAISQNAYYHLAESYINLGQKQQALNAFKNASEMSFDKEIQQDAAFNYAKLSYDIGNSYKATPEVLTDFLQNYPNHKAKSEIESLLIDSYITSKNYDKALSLLENSNDFSDKIVYQKVTYFRGVELYNQGKYSEAITMFDKSLAQRKDAAFTAKATFWKAESEYNLDNFDQALIGYKEFKGMPGANQTDEFTNIDYNLGYAYFKKKDYAAAAKHLKAFTQKSTSSEIKHDAYQRLGDSFFAERTYWEAMEAYNSAIKIDAARSDYAAFQKGISYGFVDRNSKKIEDLENFANTYNQSVYRDDALYELANTYVAEDKSADAIRVYQKLQSEMPNSAFVSRAMLKEGLIYYNDNQSQKALDKFKAVVAKYPKSDEALQAVKTARTIYIDLGQTDEYANWVKNIDFVEVADADIDNATYEAAEQQFINNNSAEAIKGFEKYLQQFPNGVHVQSAHFYLAQLYFDANQKGKATPHYEYVVKQARHQYTEQALARLSQIYLEQKDYNKAIPVLQQLETQAEFPQNITFAQSNLMKAFYQQENYQKTVAYAEKVLQNNKIEDRVKSDAQIFIARSSIKTGDEARARKAYAEVKKTATGELAAEAQYYDAYFLRQDKKYKASNESVQVIAKDYSGYKKFASKGLIVMAKNFYDLGDAFQATYILEGVIKGFEDYPEVVEEAKQELIRIKTEEAKTNSSVQSGSN